MHMRSALTYKQCNLLRGMKMKIRKEEVIGVCGELGRNKIFVFGAC